MCPRLVRRLLFRARVRKTGTYQKIVEKVFFFKLLKFPNAVVLNAVRRRNTQMSAKERQTQERSGRPRTTLGCSPPLDAREPLTRGIPQSRNSRAEESLGRGLLWLSLQVWSISAQGLLRNSSTQEFLGSGVPGHPRVVSIQLGSKKAWQWQCSSESSREQFRTIWGRRT